MAKLDKRLESYSIHDFEREQKAAKTGTIRSKGDMQFASLHHHSTFSYLDGFGLPEDHVKRAAELGMPAMALTEHGNVSSHSRFERAANDAGIKPVFGCEMYCATGQQQRKNHLTLLARDEAGYQSLLRLVERSYAEGFYYEPTVSGRMLREHREGLFILSGCLGSLFATSLVGGKNISEDAASYARGMDVARRFKSVFGSSYFLEVQPFPELERTRQVNQAAEKISRKLGIPLVVTGDVHYTAPSENEMQQILHNIRGGTRETLEQQESAWGYDVNLCHPEGRNLLYKRLRATGMSKSASSEAIDNTLTIAEACNVVLPRSPKLRYPTKEGVEPLELWRKWLREGWKFRGINQLPKKTRDKYVKRIRHEIKVIEDKDFIDYFLIVSDAVRWAKDHGIPVGPARGSAAGSLACYLLRITEVNPMLFPNLIFERFVDVTREDEPDIDLDFDDERRDEVRDYLVRKYGEKRVANLATFVHYKSKNSLDDVARVYRVPQWEVDKVKGLLIERSGGDLRANATIEDTAEMFDEVKQLFKEHPDLKKAMDLEGNLRGMSVHAAGLVLGNEPLRTMVPIHRRELHGEAIECVAMDKYDAEQMGLLKMDFLGLRTMGMFSHILEYLGKNLEDLYDIPLDDPEASRGFRENDVVGIFQFDGQATKDIASTIRPSTFQEVFHTNALCRPGPLHNGATASYINVRQGLAEPRKLHPIYNKITRDTNYEIVYQEQILRIVREMGGFDWTHVSYIRRLISRRMGEQEFNRQRDKFMAGAKKQGVKKAAASQVWSRCITAGAYAFNAAHAVSYGILAWWSMYFKRRHPKEFYAAALRKFPAKQTKYLRDAAKHGVKVLPPHPRKSDVSWTPTKSGVRAGFMEVPGIGRKTAEVIVEYQPKSWSDLLNIKGIGPITVNKIQEFVNREDPFDVERLQRVLGSVRDALDDGELGELPSPTHFASEIPYEAGEDIPLVWCGVVLKRNLRDLFEYHLSKRGEPLDPETVNSPDKREWVVMQCEDEEEVTYVTFDRFSYPKWKKLVWQIEPNKDIILVQGKKRGFLNKRDILVEKIWVIEE